MFNIAEMIKNSNNPYASIASQSVCGDVLNWVDTGSYILNALVSGSIFGGIPGNKIICLAGPEGTGKTYFTLAACKHFQEINPESIIVYFESEAALTKNMLSSRNLDLNRFVILPVTTVQEFKNQCLRIVEQFLEEKQNTPVLIVLDSLGNLSTSKELEDSVKGEETRDMTRAQIIKAAFRVLSLKLGAAGIPMIITNHVYDNIGGGPYAPKEQSGGSGPRYASSIIIGLTKAKDKEGDIHTGSIITCTAIKSRLTKEGLKVKSLIKFDGGLDRYYGLLDVAEKMGIFKKVSTRYELPDGSKAFGKAIERNPTKYFTPEILDQIDEYIRKEFMYGVKSNLNEVEDNECD